MSRYFVRNHPHFLTPHLENARTNKKSAAIRNAASSALILLSTCGRGRRSKAWGKDFERLCEIAGVVK